MTELKGYSIKTISYELFKTNNFLLPKKNFVTKYKINKPAYLKIGKREIKINKEEEEKNTIEMFGISVTLKEQKKWYIIDLKDVNNYLSNLVPDTEENNQLLNVSGQIFESQMQLLEVDKEISKLGLLNIKEGMYTSTVDTPQLSFIGKPPRSVIVEETYLEIPIIEQKLKEELDFISKEDRKKLAHIEMIKSLKK